MKRFGALLAKVAHKVWNEIATPQSLHNWQDIGAQRGGQVVRRSWRAPNLLVPYKGFDLTMTLDDETGVTSVTTAFDTASDFCFTIRRRTVVKEVLSSHIQRFYSGYTSFDDMFIVTGDSFDRLQRFLSGERLRQLLESHPEISVSLQKEVKAVQPPLQSFRLQLPWPEQVPTGRTILSAEVHSVTDPQRLHALFDIQQEMLDRLCEQNIAPCAGPTSQSGHDSP
jgi:hypothetical protein